MVGGGEKEYMNEYENKRKKKPNNLHPLPPEKMESKPLGGTWAPKLHPVPSNCSKTSEET